MREPRSGVWTVRSQFDRRRLICIWSAVYCLDWRNTETDEQGREICIEKPARCRVTIHRAPKSVPIVVPATGRSSWFRWETIRKFQKKHGFIAAQVELRELDGKSIGLFGQPWAQLSYQQCLETLCEIGRQNA